MPAPSGQRVNVYARVRPGGNSESVACAVSGPQQVTVTPPDAASRAHAPWEFDGCYSPEVDQQTVYDDVGAPILESVLQGYNGTVLAYGQTGSGKTHTLLNVGEERSDAGLVPRLVAALFVAIKVDVRHVYSVRASFAQIYNEQIDDLLNKSRTNLRVKPKGTGHEVEGLSAIECKTPGELLALFDSGRRALVYAETKMNKHSSRSHAVLQLHVSRRERVLDGASGLGLGAGGVEGGVHGLNSGSRIATLTSGKLTIVDLAGSERVKKSGADEDTSGRRMKEAIHINTSLLGLSNVMKALSTQATHIPYRDSKLTHMLSDALGGNCRTSLVVCVSPSGGDASETTAALEFGSRAMKVRTHAVVNSTEVALDAAALAADLSEALTLQAEGGLNGQLLAMEAELRTRQKEMQALEEAQKAEAERREGDLSAALAHSEHVKQQAARAGEEACELRRQLASALRAAEESREKCDDLAAQLADEVTDRRELEESLAVKARDVQLAEQRVEDAMAEAGEAKEELAAAKREAQMMREEASKEEKGATAALAATRGELEGARAELARLRAELSDREAAMAAREEEVAAEAAAREEEVAAEAAAREAEVAAERRRTAEEHAAAMESAAHERRQAEDVARAAAETLKQRLASVETARRDEAAAAEAAVATLEVQLDVALEALHEADASASDGFKTLRHRLRAATSAVVEKEGGLAELHDELAAMRDELDRERAENGSVRQELMAARSELGEEEGRLAAERSQVEAALEAQTSACDAMEVVVPPLQSLCEGLSARLASEGVESSAKIRALTSAFRSVRCEYERALGELSGAQREKSNLRAQIVDVEALLAAEGRRREEVRAQLSAELSAREVELASALDDSSGKAQQLAVMSEEVAEQAEANAHLRAEAAEAAHARDAAADNLRHVEQQLRMAVTEREALQAELATLSSIAQSELADAEAGRLAEVAELLQKCNGTEASLVAQQRALAEQKASAEAQLATAEAQLAETRDTAQRQRRELWQRLKRQAVVQAAAVRQLQHGLFTSKRAHESLEKTARAQTSSAAQALAQRDAELDAMRTALRAAEARHSRQLAASGVTAIKHGRKGKPHPRHVRCTSTRLEWSRPGDDKGRGYDKGIAVLSIDAIEGGLATDVARRNGRGKDELFLCVTSSERSLDLEFPTRAARDEWWTTLNKWRSLAHVAAGLTPPPPPPPSGGANTLNLPAGGGAATTTPAERRPPPASSPASSPPSSLPDSPGAPTAATAATAAARPSASRLQISPTSWNHGKAAAAAVEPELHSTPERGLTAGALVSHRHLRSSPNPEAAA